MNDMTMAGIGHNTPPGPIVPEAIITKVEDFTDAAGAWLDLSEIATKEQAEKATDFLNGARKTFKEIEAARKAAKKPHDDAARAVQEAFKPLLAKVELAANKVGDMQTKWLRAERDREEAERLQREADAKRVAEEAERKGREAEARNDIDGMVEADAAAQEAEKAAKSAAKPVSARASSATGAGRTVSLRTTWFADVENINHAFVVYRDRPEVREMLERLATADVRAQQGEKTAPQGFKLRKEEKAA